MNVTLGLGLDRTGQFIGTTALEKKNLWLSLV